LLELPHWAVLHHIIASCTALLNSTVAGRVGRIWRIKGVALGKLEKAFVAATAFIRIIPTTTTPATRAAMHSTGACCVAITAACLNT
jgi:hypothetical protein